MTVFKNAFPNRERVLFAAIHVEPDLRLLMQDLDAAHRAGADGAILVNNNRSVGDSRLCGAFHQARKDYPNWFLGLNMLNKSAFDALRNTPDGANALWFDDSEIDESLSDEEAVAYLRSVRQEQFLRQQRLPSAPHLLLMPSIAMKYVLPETKDVARVARLAMPFGDIIVTSGSGTGSAADPEKFRKMAPLVAPKPLANASGTSIANVDEQMAAGVRVFIVNTHIAVDERISYSRAKALADRIHA